MYRLEKEIATQRGLVIIVHGVAKESDTTE